MVVDMVVEVVVVLVIESVEVKFDDAVVQVGKNSV